MDLIINILNLIHLFVFVFPFFVFFIDPKILKPYFKYIFLLYILVPTHWALLENKCIITTMNMKLGDLKKEKTSSKFSEKYMRSIYEPIMKLFGWEWNSKNLEKMVSLNWLLLLVLLWIYCFFFIYKK